jgi:hypothetical protein
MLIASIELAVMERAPEGALVVPDVQLHFWAEFFRANPMLARRGITFEAFLDHQVRNGALFEKIACPKPNRRRASRFFTPRARSEA